MTYLEKYKIIVASECKRIYKAKGYHFKRLKVLEKEGYIMRVNRYYIKLAARGTRLMREIGYDYHRICRTNEYQDRVKEITKIAALTIDSEIEFLSSWEMKDRGILTEKGRKFIGELTFQGKKCICYYISKDKEYTYTRQLINDIQKTIDYKNVLIFVDNYKYFSKSNQYFRVGKESTVIIKASKENLERMRLFQRIDLYDVIKQYYKGKEVLLSAWKKADYMTETREYIILMPFIDTEKLHKLNIFYKNNRKSNRKIDIITLKENKEKINEILTDTANIIELDDLLGGVDGETQEI